VSSEGVGIRVMFKGKIVGKKRDEGDDKSEGED
jgi:hypothetical protein